MHKTVHFVQRTLSFAAVEGWLAEKKLHGYEFQVRALLPPPVSLPAAEVAMLVAVCRELHGPQRRAVVGLAVLLLHGPELGRLPPVL